MEEARLAFIGGTGLYRIEGLNVIDMIDVDTPFGSPSSSVTLAEYDGRKAYFLPRHGADHRFLPTEIPVKANIWALKKLGVKRIVAVSAVGSLKEKIHPRDLIIPNQIIDRTKSRVHSFFGNGIVGHVGFADPFCPALSDLLYKTAKELNYTVHSGETYVCMEGPLFSTRAESRLHQKWGGGVIGMTALPEAKLAREAEMCYAMLALSTDYDCWKDDGEDVTIDIIIENLQAATNAAQEVIKSVIGKVDTSTRCECEESARYAIITEPSRIPKKVKDALRIFYGKYWDT